MIAAVIIAGGKREELIDEKILPSLEGFDEIVVVGVHRTVPRPVRYLHVADLTKTTTDALVKRDVGTLAVRSDVVLYLSDDHAALPNFAVELRAALADGIMPWDVLVPARWVDHPEHGRIQIPNGEAERYCAGHGGVFRRRVVMDRPWAAQKHHRNWDVIASHDQLRAGFKFVAYPRLGILDLEPQALPWQ